MNRVQRVAFRLAAVAAIILCSGVSAIQAQKQAPQSSTPAPDASKESDAAKAPDADDDNPFAAKPAPRSLRE